MPSTPNHGTRALHRQRCDDHCRVAESSGGGPLFLDWEFTTLFGVSRAELAEVSRAWPKVDEFASEVDRAVSNALGNLAGYPHGYEAEWDQYLSVPATRLVEVLKRWRMS